MLRAPRQRPSILPISRGGVWWIWMITNYKENHVEIWNHIILFFPLSRKGNISQGRYNVCQDNQSHSVCMSLLCLPLFIGLRAILIHSNHFKRYLKLRPYFNSCPNKDKLRTFISPFWCIFFWVFFPLTAPSSVNSICLERCFNSVSPVFVQVESHLSLLKRIQGKQKGALAVL